MSQCADPEPLSATLAPEDFCGAVAGRVGRFGGGVRGAPSASSENGGVCASCVCSTRQRREETLSRRHLAHGPIAAQPHIGLKTTSGRLHVGFRSVSATQDRLPHRRPRIDSRVDSGSTADSLQVAPRPTTHSPQSDTNATRIAPPEGSPPERRPQVGDGPPNRSQAEPRPTQRRSRIDPKAPPARSPSTAIPERPRIEKAESITPGFCLVANPCSIQLALDLDEMVWRAIRMFNEAHLKKVGHKSSWTARADLMTAFVSEVAEAAKRTT